MNSYFVPKHVQDRPDLSHLCKALFSMYLCKRNMRSWMSSRIQLLCILLCPHSVSGILESLLETLCLWILVPFLKLCTNWMGALSILENKSVNNFTSESHVRLRKIHLVHLELLDECFIDGKYQWHQQQKHWKHQTRNNTCDFLLFLIMFILHFT